MGAAFGADFNGVRMHTGTESAALNDRLQASAFTLGSDIFFRDSPDLGSLGPLGSMLGGPGGVQG